MTKVKVISLPEWYKNEAEMVNMLFEGGLKQFHLRKKTGKYNINDFHGFFKKIPVRFHPYVFVHDDHWLKAHYQIGGLHFNNNIKFGNLGEPEPGMIYSQAVHSIEDLYRLPPEIDQTLLGPVFDSISKEGYHSAFPDKTKLAEEINKVKQHRPELEIYALGGVKLDNINEINRIGFNGFAMLGEIWQIQGNRLSEELIWEKWEKIMNKIHHQ